MEIALHESARSCDRNSPDVNLAAVCGDVCSVRHTTNAFSLFFHTRGQQAPYASLSLSLSGRCRLLPGTNLKKIILSHHFFSLPLISISFSTNGGLSLRAPVAGGCQQLHRVSSHHPRTRGGPSTGAGGKP